MITRCVEKPNSRRVTLDKDGREYEYVLTIVTNSVNDDENTILRYPGVPRGGAPYINHSVIDAGAPLVSYELERTDKYIWEMLCKHSSKASGKPKKKQEEEPLRWPTEIHWGSRRIETFPLFDRNRKPFLNSCDDPIKNKPPIEIYHAVVTLTRFEAQYNPVRAMQFAGKVNSTTWFACPAYTAKMEWPEATLTYIEALERYFWKITYSFEIAPEGWLPTGKNKYTSPCWIADTGTQCYLSLSDAPTGSATKTKGLTRDDQGLATGEEKFLDGFGYQYEVDAANGKLPKMREFYLYDTIDFNQLRLP